MANEPSKNPDVINEWPLRRVYIEFKSFIKLISTYKWLQKICDCIFFEDKDFEIVEYLENSFVRTS